ncbi:MAG: hypothetical protein DCF20_14665 [Pseudanabaena sp.]|nr:MAG: hypothetical protein DCF20_14665 [Pseudanabaena sp.]
MLREHRELRSIDRSWQSQFIRENFLLIGYHTLRGVATSDKGITVCIVDIPPTNFKPSFHIWQFRTQFISAEFASTYLLEMGISSRQIPSLVQAINSYDPQQEIILAMNTDQNIEIYYLQNLKISPTECYKQVCDRWDEFMPDGLPPDSLRRFIYS